MKYNILNSCLKIPMLHIYLKKNKKVCPLWMKVRCLCKPPDGEGLVLGKTESCSGGQGHAQSNSSPIVC